MLLVLLLPWMSPSNVQKVEKNRVTDANRAVMKEKKSTLAFKRFVRDNKSISKECVQCLVELDKAGASVILFSVYTNQRGKLRWL